MGILILHQKPLIINGSQGCLSATFCGALQCSPTVQPPTGHFGRLKPEPRAVFLQIYRFRLLESWLSHRLYWKVGDRALERFRGSVTRQVRKHGNENGVTRGISNRIIPPISEISSGTPAGQPFYFWYTELEPHRTYKRESNGSRAKIPQM